MRLRRNVFASRISFTHLAMGMAFLIGARSRYSYAQVNLTDWPKVQMEMIGADAKGASLQNLSVDQLTIREDGHLLAPTELRQATDAMSICILMDEALKSRYLLTYSSGNQSKDGRLRQVDVRFDETHQKAMATIHAPQGYYAPSQ